MKYRLRNGLLTWRIDRGTFAQVKYRSGKFVQVEYRSGAFAQVKYRSGKFVQVEYRSGAFAQVEYRSAGVSLLKRSIGVGIGSCAMLDT